VFEGGIRFLMSGAASKDHFPVFLSHPREHTRRSRTDVGRRVNERGQYTFPPYEEA
jgi:hypothetical protein